jgi:hypothetical protein
MAGNHHRDSPGPDAGASGFLARWSERKRALVPPAENPPSGDTLPPPVTGPGTQQSETTGAQKVLTDRDMPPLESLDEESNYSGFLSPGVSDALHRRALRKLFGAAKFQVRDGLDDYDTDYNLLQPLRRVLAGMTQDELTQQLQRATDNTTVNAEDTGVHPADEQTRSAADPAQQAPGTQLPAGRPEETVK